jgi:hypothetical protein
VGAIAASARNQSRRRVEQFGVVEHEAGVGPDAALHADFARVERPPAQVDERVGPALVGAAVVGRLVVALELGLDRTEDELAVDRVEQPVDRDHAVERGGEVQAAA